MTALQNPRRQRVIPTLFVLYRSYLLYRHNCRTLFESYVHLLHPVSELVCV